MGFLKHHPIFLGLIALLLVGSGFNAWRYFSVSSAAAAARASYEERRAQLESLQRQAPYPNQDNVAAVRAAAGQANDIYQRMTQVVTVSDVQMLGEDVPTSRTEAFFQLARWIEETRQRVTAAGWTVAPTERFAFGQFNNEGPDVASIPVVWRQRQIIDALLSALIKAAPQEFRGIRREQVSGGNAGGAAGGDFFTIAPSISARRPGAINTLAFQVSFTGQTSTLRSFLNTLAVSPLPLLVRSVEVTQAGGGEQRNTPAAPQQPVLPFALPAGGSSDEAPEQAAPAGPIPIIAANSSSFVVVIEFVQLVLPESNTGA